MRRISYWLDGEADEAAPSPTPREVVRELGLILAGYLAIAFAIVVTVRVMGIA